MFENRADIKTFGLVDGAGKKQVCAKLSRTCKACKRSYCSIQSLRAHTRYAHAKWSFACSRCLRRFYAKADLVRHCVKSHGVKVAPFAENENRNESCKRSSDDFRTEKSIRRTRLARGLKCQKCGHVCACEDVFEAHCKRPHDYGCANCPRRFITKHRLIAHCQQHHLIRLRRTPRMIFELANRPFGCSDCLTFFKMKHHLTAHLAMRHKRDFAISEDAMPCQFCGQYFERINQHMRLVHSDLFSFACFYCPKKFPSEDAKYAHEIRIHRTSNFIKCDYCAKKFFHASTKEDHVTKCHLEESGGSRSIHGFLPGTSPKVKKESKKKERVKPRRVIRPKVKIECEFCTKPFSNRMVWATHLRMAHQQDRPFACEHCDETFRYPLAKRYHIAKTHKCGYCDVVIVDAFDLAEHMRSLHPSAKTIEDELKRKQQLKPRRVIRLKIKANCEFCSLQFSNVTIWAMHMRTVHQQDRPFVCEHCGETFRYPLARKHHVAKKHTCGLCDIVLVDASDRAEHMQSIHLEAKEVLHEDTRWKCMRPQPSRHARSRPKTKANCKFCSKPFSNLTIWAMHMRTVHQQDRPFVCEHCGAAFSCSKAMRSHVTRIHRCQHCDDVMMGDFDRAEHMRLVHPESMIPICEFCCSEFASEKICRAHVRSQHAALLRVEPLYACRLCSTKFTSLRERNVHESTAHLTQEERYKCGICAETFARLALVYSHVCTARKHACEHCGKSFNAQDMVTHRKTKHPSAEESEVKNVEQLDNSAPGAQRAHASIAELGLPCTSVANAAPQQPAVTQRSFAPVRVSRDQMKAAHPWNPLQQRPLILRLAAPLSSSVTLTGPVAAQRVSAEASSFQSSHPFTTSSCQDIVRAPNSTIHLLRLANSGKIALLRKELLDGRQLFVTAIKKNALSFERHPGEEGRDDIRCIEDDKLAVKRTNAVDLPKQDSEAADCSGREVKEEIMDSDSFVCL